VEGKVWRASEVIEDLEVSLADMQVGRVKYRNEAFRDKKKLNNLRKERDDSPRDKLIDQYKKGLSKSKVDNVAKYEVDVCVASCSGAGVQQDEVMEEETNASKANEGEELRRLFR
jgi:hypothetical protein